MFAFGCFVGVYRFFGGKNPEVSIHDLIFRKSIIAEPNFFRIFPSVNSWWHWFMTHVEALGISNIINFHCTGGGTSLEQAETLGSCDFLESFVRSFAIKSWWGQNNLWSSTSRTSGSQTILCWRRLSHNVFVVGVCVAHLMETSCQFVFCIRPFMEYMASCMARFTLGRDACFSLVDALQNGKNSVGFHLLPHHHKEFHTHQWVGKCEATVKKVGRSPLEIPETLKCLSNKLFTLHLADAFITGIDDGSFLLLYY